MMPGCMSVGLGQASCSGASKCLNPQCCQPLCGASIPMRHLTKTPSQAPLVWACMVCFSCMTCCLNRGSVPVCRLLMFHGPVREAVPFFETLGFICPERKDHASFLQEVTTLKGKPLKTPCSCHQHASRWPHCPDAVTRRSVTR